MKLRSIILGFAVLAAICLVGCDGGAKGRVAVSGTVTVNGEPGPTGSVVFEPIEGTTGPTSGCGIVDGAYDLPATKGIMPGKYRVIIEANKVVQGKIHDMSGEMVDGEKLEPILPAKYSYNMGKPQEELTAEVKKGKNVVDFALTD